MTLRTKWMIGASFLACLCLIQSQAASADKTSAGAGVSQDTAAAQAVEGVSTPRGVSVREDGAGTAQGRPNARYNTRRVYPIIPPTEMPNLPGPRGALPEGACELEPCEIRIYNNMDGPNSAGAIGDNNGTPTYDDMALVGNDRFICQFLTILGGLNNSGGLLPITLIVRSGNYYPFCPDDPMEINSQILYTATQNVPMTNPFNFINYDVNPPIFLDYDFFWCGFQTPPESNDAGWSIAGEVSGEFPEGVPEVGFTEDNIVIPNNNGICEDLGPGQQDDYFWYGGPPTWAGQAMTIFANPGPPGACCYRDVDVGGGVADCQDGVTRSGCLINTTNIWKPGECVSFGEDPSCDLCLSQEGACDMADPEGEDACTSGYVDTYNADCTILTLPTLSCGQAICGQAGTYKSSCTLDTDCASGVTCISNVCEGPENRRDNDWYKIVLTESTEVTITLTARFLVQMSLMNNGGDPQTCTDTPLDFVTGRACDTVSITRCLPPGTWNVMVRPDTFKTIPCDTRYRLEMSCAPCALDTGACCDASSNGCSDLAELACLGRNGLYQGDGTNCMDDGGVCPGIPTNDNCVNPIIILTGAQVARSFDTTFASDSTTPPADPGDCVGEVANGTTPIRKDIFFWYRIPTNFNGTAITQADVVISTNDQPEDPHTPSYDPWVVVYGQPNQSNPCTTALCTRPQQACNDDVVDGGTPFKYNAMSHLTLRVAPDDVGQGNFFFGVGDCILIRVGRGLSPVVPSNPTGGQGWLNIDLIPRGNQDPFSEQTGRCCFDDGSCNVYVDDATCLGLNGYPRARGDYFQGDITAIEPIAGCKADPCPQPGEACFRALDLNSLLGGDSGTVTRAISDVVWYKYIVPGGSGGLVIDTCDSTGFFDPIIGVFPNDLTISGDCNLGAMIKSGDDCTSTTSAADGALTTAACYGGINATSSACLCLSVGPGLDVDVGDEIYIAFGSSNVAGKQFVFPGSPRLIVDPVTNPLDGTVASVLTVTPVSACFTCPSDCPMDAIDEGASDQICADTSASEPQDTYNGGCNATPPSFRLPAVVDEILDCSGGPVKICGRAGNYRHPFPCDSSNQCPGGGQCTGENGFCLGENRFVNRDEDWFKVRVDEPRTIRWKLVSAEFAVELAIFADPTGNCTEIFTLALDDTDFACVPPEGTPSELEVTATVCAGTYYLVMRPSVFGGLGQTSCTAEYVVEVSCEEFDQPTPCCPGDMNGDGHVNGLDIQKWISVLFTPPSVLDDFLGCFSANYCRADIDTSGTIDMSDMPGFVNLLVTANKPVCTLEPTCSDPATGQYPQDSRGVTRSDLDPQDDARAAECFRPLEDGMISTVCWWGAYADLAGIDCGPEPDCFRINFYAPRSDCDNNGANRCPGTRICPPTQMEPVCSQYLPLATRTATGFGITVPGGALTEYFYTATLPNPVPVSAGQCYWIEIVNTTPQSLCLWHWEQSNQGDTRHAAQDIDPADGLLPTDYTDCDVQERDLAFSINLRIDKNGCAKPIGTCCYDPDPIGGGVLCRVTTQEVCESVLIGIWELDDSGSLTLGDTCDPAGCNDLLGRCCYLDDMDALHCESTLSTNCTAVGGQFVLGASCPCPTGRCCVDGECSSPTTEIECLSLGGIFLEGADCSEPCPTGICNNDQACQTPNVINDQQQHGYVSDANNGITVADDFRPLFTDGANFVSSVCWRGFHRQNTTQSCDPAPETFTITYYRTTPNPGGMPDLGNVMATFVDVTPTRSQPVPAEGVVGGGTQYQYELFHDPVAISPNQCHWIEIVSTTDNASCVFLWATSAQGNQKAAVRSTGATSFPYQMVDRDLAFCLGPVSLVEQSCGADNPTTPSNDICPGPNIGPGPVAAFVGRTLGANPEGSTAGCNPAVSSGDVFYRWTQGPVATGTTFTLCFLNTTYDAQISVHKTVGLPGGGCPTSNEGASQINTLTGCNADGCPGVLGTNWMFFQGRPARVSITSGQAATQLLANTPYIVRVAGENKSVVGTNSPEGWFTLQITQP